MITKQTKSYLQHYFAINRAGFTLVEMLVAMAITLLMMAAIGRGFAFVGERVKDSRANLQLSADLSDITTRLRDELSRCTVDLTPNTGGPDQAGYFLYYEGPVTDVTSSIFGADDEDPDNPTPFSRFGDFDDYLAFTAVAAPGTWFTGKVPRYLLDQRTAELAGDLYDPLNFTGDPWDPIVIRSKHAEIVYFASPEYTDFVPNPIFTDADGEGLPDRIRLHRRVLLIRPDLNLTSTGALPVRTMVGANFMQADTWPTANVADIVGAADPDDGWLYGMAGVHQQCDLSLRRVLSTVVGNEGEPTVNVAANSLSDLSKPHNRFAHVRAPWGGGLGSPTSMPLLALGSRISVLDQMTTVGTPERIAPPNNSSTVITPDVLSGFLRPEFVVGSDRTHNPITNSWGSRRLAEDVVTNNLLAFDIKIFDPAVRSFTLRDSGLVVGPNDAGYREALDSIVADSTQNADTVLGGFVDLMYPVLAGGSLRGGIGPFDRITPDPSPVGIPMALVPLTPFSGISTDGSAASRRYTNSLYRSGRIVIDGTNFRVFQPAFDTYTSYYERDGILQSRVSAVNEGTLWRGSSGTNIDLGSDGLDSVGLYDGGQATADRRFGADDLGEHDTQPPFVTPAEAIQVTARLYNPSTRQIKQMSVIHRGKR